MRRRIDLSAANDPYDDPRDEARDRRSLVSVDDAEPPPVAPDPGPDRSTLARALTELEASKARVERDAKRAADELRANLVVELLPLLDNLDRTVAAAEQSDDAPAVLEGARLVRTQFETVLSRYGVERIEALHRTFDPKIHDAVGLVPVRQPDANGVVVDEVAPGYRFGDRLLRPAKVVVGRYGPRVH